MSLPEQRDVICRKCGREQRMTMWLSANVDESPELRDRLFNADINVLTCEACGYRAWVGVPFMYHDMTRRFIVQCLPFERLRDGSLVGDYTVEGKLKLDPRMAAVADPYFSEPHVVFSMMELAHYVMFREMLHDRHRGAKSLNGDEVEK